ncbi:unnamed protein product [Durusdinium trenchii]|uniref:Uncharacterized protein n=1 Tax=Durusdinium trenchii TaxID=1381693 RepID=A0ABP0NH64_9DINO
MANYMDLFSQLEAQAGQTNALSPEALNEGPCNLANIAASSVGDDQRLGKPQCSVKIVGDPETVDRYGNYFHYLGPALVVCFDNRGVVRTLEFVGVEGGKKNSNYIKEVWQYHVEAGAWKYRVLEGMQGVPAHRIQCADSQVYYGREWISQGNLEEFHPGREWPSEKGPDETPPPSFLAAFNPNSETLLVNLRLALLPAVPSTAF